MIYLYFNRDEKSLHGYNDIISMGKHTYHIKWENIDSVTADHENGQIVAHEMGTGKVIEFPIQATMLSCKEAVNINK